MAFLFGLLTVVLVLTCVVLIFLVLIQLPKKDAGAGLAFGGAASDALFGAGSGNMLTKITKYAAGIFFVLAIVLGLMGSHARNTPVSDFERDVEKQQRTKAAPAEMAQPPAEMPAPAAAPAGSNAAAPATTPAPTSVPPTNK
jgi:preprotein translocase subunit SecG